MYSHRFVTDFESGIALASTRHSDHIVAFQYSIHIYSVFHLPMHESFVKSSSWHSAALATHCLSKGVIAKCNSVIKCMRKTKDNSISLYRILKNANAIETPSNFTCHGYQLTIFSSNKQHNESCKRKPKENYGYVQVTCPSFNAKNVATSSKQVTLQSGGTRKPVESDDDTV